jgi:histidinol-phosphate aminotransferase
MKFINSFLSKLVPYSLASHIIWDKDNFDNTIIKLDWNEATIPPSPLVIDRLKHILSKNEIFNYYPNTDNKQLRHLLSNYLSLSLDNFEYFSSSDVVHEHIARLLLKVNDRIVILGPTYDNFRVTCESQGALCSIFESELDSTSLLSDFYDELKKVMPKLAYICNPNNPTGRMFSMNAIDHLLNEFPDIIFIIDEAYSEFAKHTTLGLIKNNDNIIITRTFSKAFALANFRAGYICSNHMIISNIRNLKNHKNISSITQEAIIGALQDVDYMWNYVDQVNKAREFMSVELNKFNFVKKVYKSEANFLLVEFVDFETKCKVDSFLQSRSIFVRNLSHSSKLSNCLRITIGTLSQMKIVSDNLKNLNENSDI